MSNVVDHRAIKMIQEMRKNHWSIQDVINNGFLEKEMGEMANDMIRKEYGYPPKGAVDFMVKKTMDKAKKMIDEDSEPVIEIPNARVYRID